MAASACQSKPTPKQHLDLFSRFCRAHVFVQQTLLFMFYYSEHFLLTHISDVRALILPYNDDRLMAFDPGQPG